MNWPLAHSAYRKTRREAPCIVIAAVACGFYFLVFLTVAGWINER